MFTAHSVSARRSRRSTPLYLERLEDRLAPVAKTMPTDMVVLANGPASTPLAPYSVTITLSNNGPNPADQVVLTDTISGFLGGVFTVTPAASNPDTFTESYYGDQEFFTVNAPILPSTNVDI